MNTTIHFDGFNRLTGVKSWAANTPVASSAYGYNPVEHKGKEGAQQVTMF
jgi:hypothetical protein